MSYERFQKVEQEFTKQVPDFKVKFKDESWLMKLIGKVLFFNKGFMNSFVTTLGSTVYFPTRSRLEKSTSNHHLVTLSHEYMHARDAQRMNPILFGFLYGVPQIFSLLALLLCFYKVWLGLLLFAIFLAPLPAYYRMKMERRGYATSLFALHELQKENNLSHEACRDILLFKAKEYNKHFTGSNYYWMWPFGTEKYLQQVVEKVLQDRLIEEDEVYQEVRKALKLSK